MRKILILMLMVGALVFCFSGETYANNISVSNISITSQDSSASTCNVQFDISWNNSWRNSINYDSAWVFIKYSTDNGVTWSHATLKASTVTNPSGFVCGTTTVGGSIKSLDVLVPTDKKGAFVQIASTDTGAGNLSAAGIQFVWDWGSDKLSSDGVTAITASTTVILKVFAIEMVYIPQGTFKLGTGTTETGAFYCYPDTANPYTVASETVTIGTTAANLYYSSSTNAGDRLGTGFTASFPKGYNAFYIMKYEISEGQYSDFLNTLTATQKGNRWGTGNFNSARYYIKKATTNCPFGAASCFGCDADNSAGTDGSANYNELNETADGQWIACGFLSWPDFAAYNDWAGLRPSTELEFEKACRGPTAPVFNEYAWGNASIAGFYSSYRFGTSNSGQSNESVTAATYTPYPVTQGNARYTSNGFGPLRVGAFAANAKNRGRITSGASYYGVMDLSGNQWERSITVGNPTGRSFTGLHGNGSVDTNGNADVTNWPATDSVGIGFRGGSFPETAATLRVSDRTYAAYTSVSRDQSYGGRGARTAP